MVVRCHPANWRPLKAKAPTSWPIKYQVKTQVSCAMGHGSGWEAKSASLQSLIRTILSANIGLTRGMRWHMWQFWNAFYLKKKGCHQLKFHIFLVLEVATLSIFSQVSGVISQITRSDNAKEHGGSFWKRWLFELMSTYWISVNTPLPCNYFHNGFLQFWFFTHDFHSIKFHYCDTTVWPFCIPFLLFS